MPAYGDSLEDWAERLRQFLPDDHGTCVRLKPYGKCGRRDWSMEVAVHLGLALAALRLLQADGIDTTANHRRLVEESLAEAWRELLFIRMRNIPIEALADVPRFVTLTRTGRIIDGSDQTPIPFERRHHSHPDDKSKSHHRPESRSKRTRRGTRGT